MIIYGLHLIMHLKTFKCMQYFTYFKSTLKLIYALHTELYQLCISFLSDISYIPNLKINWFSILSKFKFLFISHNSKFFSIRKFFWHF